ncbi:synaptic vesicle glycoprotein 2A isoform X2 [Drosophila ficusphila]|uniref:synaptic vesicle glycoprotein 2A isoform X2 n=1 Tax=Drosophila ficusphila TaxID=30025 RepID=UPI0007E68A95|nr:synaptic vesicle glycoprotein 2A isoform X2 [Drosophila ficusphila]
MVDRAKENAEEPADFEAAIAECGFGLFNLFILCSAIPCLTAMVFSASALSYVMPSAECDLDLSIVDKGLLHAVTYAGMIISAIPWGFVADTVGRRPVLISGGWLDGFFVLCASFSQNTAQLMVFKFFDGFIICGPFAVVVSYLAEFHGKKHRPYIMLFVGLCVSVGSMILPLLAYFLMPVDIYFKVGTLQFRTWQVFLAISSLPSFLCGLLHIFLPESPKFLMSQGNYKKAMKSLQSIYHLNKRKSRDSYPVKRLSDPTPDRSDDIDGKSSTIKERFGRAKKKFNEGLWQLRPMFSKPYLTISLLVYCLHFCQIMCVNSVRLWLPQIFATMDAMESLGANDTSMCAVLDHNAMAMSMNEEEKKVECALHHNPSSYVDNIIVSGIGLVGFLLIFPLMRIRVVNNHILMFLFICIFLLGGLYFVKTALVTMIVSAIYLTLMGICATTVIGMSVVIFPTLMRTMVLLLIMTFGRLGSVSGNLLLPIFMQLGCLAPFIWLCVLMSIAFLFSLFLKVDDQQALS